MTQSVRISHPEHLLFSRWTASGKSEERAGRLLSWTSDALDAPSLISCIGSFDAPRSFNSLQIDPHPLFPEAFPETFRFEISQDGKVWEPILREANFRAGSPERGVWNFPLISARYIKFVFLADRTNENGKYHSAFGEFRVMISGIVDIRTSSELDRLWVKENLMDGRGDYGWSSALRTRKEEEHINIDLGSINRVGELRLLSKDDPETFFPSIFRVTYSEDNISWHHLMEENGFLVEPATWYSWRFLPLNIRYLKISIDEGARTREGKYISQIIELELYAAPDLLEKGGHSSPEPVQYSSVLRSGIVRLAMDGEVREGIAVQASDRRLRDATTESRGIVELAADGESIEGVAVQGSDRRLKHATEDLPGIVRLARDGEVRPGHVVQSSDSRLLYSTEESAGIVELASDGEVRAGVAVQGNDRRLRLATVQSPGILKFAEHNSIKPNEAVQGSDDRLKDGTTERKGIMRFARLGESTPDAAVQGNDPRLRLATTETPGIIELARNGEDKAGVVVQGDDRRLKSATEENEGIVSFNPPGGSLAGKAIQGNDPRLSDARLPLRHSHEYAPLVHSFDSHTGLIRLEGKIGEPFKSISRPPLNHAPMTGINTGGGAGVVGSGEKEGVVGSGDLAGVAGYSPSAGAGVLGASRGGHGGRFVSEKDFALVAGGSLADRNIRGSTLGLMVHGLSFLSDTLYFPSQEEGISSAIAIYFPVMEEDVISPGDILVATEKDGVLRKSMQAGSSAVIGVVVEKASIVLNTPTDILSIKHQPDGKQGILKPKGMQLVALAGVVQLRVIVEKHPIHPGDLLVTSLHSGRAEKYTGKSPEFGTVFARSLGTHRSGEGTVPAVLMTM